MSKFNRLYEYNSEDSEPSFEKTPNNDKLQPVLLESVGVNLTEMAKKGKLDPIVGRDEEINEVVATLARRRKNNPVLVGDAGVGKSSIVEGVALLIESDKCPSQLENSILYSVDMASLVAGTPNSGDFEKKIKRLLAELNSNKNIILFIDEIHMIVDKNKPIDFSNMIKPSLARGDIRCIGATTNKEYKVIEKDNALERRFQKIEVNEPTKEETLIILENIKTKYEEFHNVKYSDESLKACVYLADKYLTDRFFPDKAIDLLDEVGARTRIRNTKSKDVIDLEKEIQKIVDAKNEATLSQDFEKAANFRTEERLARRKLERIIDESKSDNTQTVKKEDIELFLGKKLNLPQLKSEENDIKKYIELESNLNIDIIGQEEAVKSVSKYLRRNAAGLKDPNRPAGVFLFVGPTGVGKTQTVKSLAKNIFNSESDVIRIDMSEYTDKYNVSRLIGSPPGYVGYGEGGQLTEKVRKKPYSIVLLDEIEKAHPSVWNMFLQVFDDGRLTDGEGRTVNFKNTVIIMTSNVGSAAVRDIPTAVGFGNKEISQKENAISIIKKELSRIFPPEFLNRIDDIIAFSNLSKDNISNIIEVELRKIRSRLSSLGYTLEISNNMKSMISDKGYDPQFGARPLKRILVKYIEEPISEEILRKTIKDKIYMDYDPNTDKVTINGSPIIEKRTYTNKFKRF